MHKIRDFFLFNFGLLPILEQNNKPMHQKIDPKVFDNILKELLLLQRPFLKQNNLHPKHAINKEKNKKTTDLLHPIGHIEKIRKQHKIKLKIVKLRHQLPRTSIPLIPSLINPPIDSKKHISTDNNNQKIPTQIDNSHKSREIAHDNHRNQIIYVQRHIDIGKLGVDVRFHEETVEDVLHEELVLDF